jgi:hypothetical protein
MVCPCACMYDSLADRDGTDATTRYANDDAPADAGGPNACYAGGTDTCRRGSTGCRGTAGSAG